MAVPEIIGSSRSTYTRVVRMVCEQKGIEYRLTEVPLQAPEIRHPSFRQDASAASRRSRAL
jgi:glutathione S-transferase